MLISIRCSYCSSKHHDHYECDSCGNHLGGMTVKDADWRYCPFCGARLYPDDLTREARMQFRGKAFRGPA